MLDNKRAMKQVETLPELEKSLKCHFYKQTTSSIKQLRQFAVQTMLLGIRQVDLEPGTWDLGPGTWNLEPRTWDLGLVTLDLELGTWDLVFGTWDLGPETWDLGPES